MYQIRYILLLLLAICLCGCRHSSELSNLATADSLANVNPDSALTLLGEMTNELPDAPEDFRMRHRLLTVKARDKAYITHTSDSLILPVVRYYEQRNEQEVLPEVYYYAGRVCRDMNDAPQALDYFLRAIEAADEQTDKRLMSLIYCQIGNVYLFQDIYDKVPDAKKSAYRYGCLANDSSIVVYNLRDIGDAFLGLNKADSAIHYYNEALTLAQKIGNEYLANTCNLQLAGIYEQLEEYDKALNFVRGISFDDEMDVAPYYSVLSDIYYGTDQLDSAAFYYRALITMGNYYHKQGGYEGLAKVARKREKYAEALRYIDGYLLYTDSIRQVENTEGVRKAEALYNYQLREQENHRLEQVSQRQHAQIVLLSVTLGGLLVLLLLGYYAYRLKQKKHALHLKYQAEKLKQITDEQYYRSNQYLDENELRIAELHRQLEDSTAQKSILEQELKLAEKELLELTNRKIEARQKLQDLSSQSLKETQIYKDVHHVAGTPGYEHLSEKAKLSKDDWRELYAAIDKAYNQFTERLKNLYPSISELGLQTSILLKMEVRLKDIPTIVNCSKQNVTSIRKRLYKTVHNQEGKPELWDEFIRHF